MARSSSTVPPSGLRLLRSTLLVAVGIVAGIGIGFAYGLIKPRPRA
ncbi:MAG TPA: hypothetical protein VKA58_13720 [Propionibacteriaceae bacterium]|nr:hypothetical protein [Propionibacteriaceae bacterium]